MKKRLWTITFALLLSLAFAFPAQAAYQDMWAKVYKNTGKLNSDGSAQLTEITSGVTFKVLAQNSDTAETLYIYGKRSLTSLPTTYDWVTATTYASATYCNGQIQFKVDPTDTTYDQYVDLIVTDASGGGYSVFVEDFDKYTHTVVIDERPNLMHHGVIGYGGSTTSEVSTGVTFLADTFVHDVRLEVVTGVASGAISIGLYSSGTGGDADGFIASATATTAGYIADTVAYTAGGSNDYISTASKYGVLLYTSAAGSAASSTTSPIYAKNGYHVYKGHIVTGSNTGILTYSGPSSGGSGAGYIHYFFTRMR